MSELAKSSREALKAKARRLASEGSGKVDSSTWTPSEPMRADVKTGLRPVSKQHEFKAGGAAAKPRADRVARKSGGKVAHKASGGYTGGDLPSPMEAMKVTASKDKSMRVTDTKAPPAPSKETVDSMNRLRETRKSGGKARPGRKSGGKAPNVTVVINDKGSKAPEGMPQAAQRIQPAPMPMMQPPQAPMPMPVQRPDQMPSPAVRNQPIALKTGGRVAKKASSYKDMQAGAGSGEGRLQKTDIAKKRVA